MLLGWFRIRMYCTQASHAWDHTQGPHHQTGAKISHNIEDNPNYAPGVVPDSYVPAPKPFMPEPASKVIVRQVYWYKDNTIYRRQSKKGSCLESLPWRPMYSRTIEGIIILYCSKWDPIIISGIHWDESRPLSSAPSVRTRSAIEINSNVVFGFLPST
jgi:hypothetical protein